LEPDGRKRALPWHIYACYSELMAAPTTVDENEEWIVLVDRALEYILGTSDRKWITLKVDALFPDRGAIERLDGKDTAAEWLCKARMQLRSNALRPEQRQALEAAIPLVRLSRIVPVSERQVSPLPNLIL
jgi:CRISPR-associated endonuclease/helicase Cas3